MSGQVALAHKLLSVVLDRVSADPSRFGGIADCYVGWYERHDVGGPHNQISTNKSGSQGSRSLFLSSPPFQDLS